MIKQRHRYKNTNNYERQMSVKRKWLALFSALERLKIWWCMVHDAPRHWQEAHFLMFRSFVFAFAFAFAWAFRALNEARTVCMLYMYIACLDKFVVRCLFSAFYHTCNVYCIVPLSTNHIRFNFYLRWSIAASFALHITHYTYSIQCHTTRFALSLSLPHSFLSLLLNLFQLSTAHFRRILVDRIELTPFYTRNIHIYTTCM